MMHLILLMITAIVASAWFMNVFAGKHVSISWPPTHQEFFIAHGNFGYVRDWASQEGAEKNGGSQHQWT